MCDNLGGLYESKAYWLFVGAVLSLFLPGWFIRLGIYGPGSWRLGVVDSGAMKTWSLGPLGSVTRFANEDFEGLTRAMYQLGKDMIIKIEAK